MVISVLRLFAIFCTAVICGKLVSKLRLPAILGWLIAGIVFGPCLAEVVTADITDSVNYKIFIKAIPHNSKCADAQQFFRQTQQKFAGRVPPLSRIFVKYDGKRASRCVLKALAVNCAVLP